MTLPVERYAALENSYRFLLELMLPGGVHKRIPKEVRKRARWCIKHYPHNFELDQLASARPDLLEKPYWVK